MPDFDLPLTHRGQTVGLLGGSFDPAHAGHAHVTRHALKLFALDQVWWLVSPGNPLKPRGPAPLPDRLARARQVMQHPRVHVSDFEAQAHTRYTAETLRKLLAARPDVRFVWLMGADNLAQFHLWQDWRGIMETVPVGVVARPGLRMTARQSYAASVYARARLPAAQSRLLARRDPPCWCFVNLPMMAISSTGLRAAGEWQAKDAR